MGGVATRLRAIGMVKGGAYSWGIYIGWCDKNGVLINLYSMLREGWWERGTSGVHRCEFDSFSSVKVSHNNSTFVNPLGLKVEQSMIRAHGQRAAGHHYQRSCTFVYSCLSAS